MTPAIRTYVRSRRYNERLKRDRQAHYTETAKRYLASMREVARKGAA